MIAEEKPFFIKLGNGLIIIVLTLAILYVAQHILVPVAFAGVIAMLLITPCRFFERQGFSRGIAALISLLLSLVFFFIVFYFISTQILSFKKDIPALITHLSGALKELEDGVKTRFDISSDSMDKFINDATSQTLTYSMFSSTFSTVSGTVLYALLSLLYIFLLLLYRRLVVKFLIKSFPDDNEKVYVVLTKARYVIKSYLVGLIIEMIVVAVLNCMGFFILGVKYAILLGVIAALLNVVPYLGIFIACILSMLVTFTTNSAPTVIGVAIVLLIVHLVDGNLLFPRIVGSKVKMNALATIFGVVVGSALWGIPGMFLAIPIIAMLKVMFEEVESLQAWCILLGDDVIAKATAKRSFMKFTNPFRKKK